MPRKASAPPDACACPCHEGKAVHVAPCCRRCPDCGRLVKGALFAAHRKVHR